MKNNPKRQLSDPNIRNRQKKVKSPELEEEPTTPYDPMKLIELNPTKNEQSIVKTEKLSYAQALNKPKKIPTHKKCVRCNRTKEGNL